jgi:ATP-dependent helicase/nuclease subunit B
MRVRVWTGPAGSGKTSRCLTELRKCECDGEAALLIVPDQFTYTADRLLLDDPSIAGTRFVRVLSFRRLAHLAAARWEFDRATLSEESRRLLLRGIVHSVGPEALGPLAQVRNAPGFVDALASAIREIKGVAGEDAAEKLAQAAHGDSKAAAIAHLIREYDAALEQAELSDPDEWSHRVARRLQEDPGPWGGRRLWIDGFMSFTPAEKVLLTAMGRVAREVTVTLCCDPGDARLALERAADASAHGMHPSSSAFFAPLRKHLRRPQFLPTLRTLIWLSEMFSGDFRVRHIKTDPYRFGQATSLARLEKGLFAAGRLPPASAASSAAPTRPANGTAQVARRRFPTPYHEVTGWARQIDTWTRLAEQPTRYRDIAILVRNLEAYRPLLQEVFDRYRIPLFVDRRRDVTAHPLLRMVFAALRMAAQGWTRRAVISVLRNPILGLPAESVDRIENLSLEYGIEFQRWYETDWKLLAIPKRERPSDEPDNEGAPERAEDPKMRRRKLAAAEARAVAGRFFPMLRAFTDLWRGREPRFSEAAQALRTLLDDLPASSTGDVGKFESWPEAESLQVAGLLEETLASGVRLMGSVPVGPGLMIRLLKDAFSRASIGLTPQTLDAVTVAEPRRSRVNEVRRAILGGLDATSFPSPHPEDPLLSDEERERLTRHGLPLASPAVIQVEEDPYLFYIACTRAIEELLLTHPALGETGAALDASPYLAEVGRVLGNELRRDDPTQPASPLEGCRHPAELTAALAGTLRELDAEESGTLATRVREEMPSSTDAITRASLQAERLRRPSESRLPDTLTEQAFPNGILAASASRLETFARCPFQHFARYLLRLEKRPEAVLTPLSTGAATHAALERFFSAPRLPRKEREIAQAIRAIFDELAQTEEFRILQEDPPSAYRWERTSRNLVHFVIAELRRLGGSLFQPAALELSFGLGDPRSWEDIASFRDTLTRRERSASIAFPPLEIRIERAPQPDARAKTSPWVVRLRGRIDRLDVTDPAQGPARALIIDYKLREPKSGIPEDLEKGVRLQVAAYLLTVREILGLDPAGAVYYSVSPQPRIEGRTVRAANPLRFSMKGFFLEAAAAEIDPEKAFLSRSRRKARADEEDELTFALKTARRQIIDLSSEILSGRIRPEPMQSSGRLPCEYCDYRDICRFDPLRDPVRRIGTVRAT